MSALADSSESDELILLRRKAAVKWVVDTPKSDDQQETRKCRINTTKFD